MQPLRSNMSFKINENDQKNLSNLAELVRRLNLTDHNPATSGNYSHRSDEFNDYAFVSESGIDKSQFSENNFIPIKISNKETHDFYKKRKSSDETDLHLAIFQSTSANCVLHSHMLDALHFADLYPCLSLIPISGLELLKGFSGVATHDTTIQIPVFENTQDISQLAEIIKPHLNQDPFCYGLILRGHGVYVWGKNVTEAKRHLEVFEYLFRYTIQKKNFNKSLG